MRGATKEAPSEISGRVPRPTSAINSPLHFSQFQTTG